MSRNTALIVSFFVLFLATPQIVAAQSPDPTVPAVRQREVKPSGLKQRTPPSMKENIRPRITGIRKQRIRMVSARMITRLEALIDRLKVLAERIETRIAKVNTENSNLDTTKAQQSLEEAKVKINDAKTELTALEQKIATTLETDDPKSQMQEIKASLSSINKSLKESHKLMVQSIRHIKGLRVGEGNTQNEKQ